MKKILLALCIMVLIGCCGCGEKEPDIVEVRCADCDTYYDIVKETESEDDANGSTHYFDSYTFEDVCPACEIEHFYWNKYEALFPADAVSKVLFSNLPDEEAEFLMEAIYEIGYIDASELRETEDYIYDYTE